MERRVLIKVNHPVEDTTALDPDEAQGLKFKITTRGELNRLEQANIQNGIAWMRRSRSTDLLSESYVRELHKRLFGEVWSWAGTFRRTGKNIGVDPLHIAVELRKLLGDMQYWFDSEVYAPREAVIRFHHRLTAIHPFPNGNGRHARIMADALLIKLYRLPAVDWAGGQDLASMGDRRKYYIQALRAADGGDYEPLLAFAGAR